MTPCGARSATAFVYLSWWPGQGASSAPASVMASYNVMTGHVSRAPIGPPQRSRGIFILKFSGARGMLHHAGIVNVIL